MACMTILAQMNSLPNGRDSHLGEIENDFKDPEDEFWETNNSVSQEILKYTRNSSVEIPFRSTALLLASRLFGSLI